MFHVRFVTEEDYPNVDTTVPFDTFLAARRFANVATKEGVVISEGNTKHICLPAKGVKYAIIEEQVS